MGASAAVAGLVLAAGGGRRAGGPKALVRDASTGSPWLADRVTTLAAAGCAPVLVVLGAGADLALDLVPAGAHTVVNPDWALGLASSLRAGLDAAQRLSPLPAAVLVALVDTPGLTVAAVQRVAACCAGADEPGRVLARATHGGHPGHPVLIGRHHWAGVRAAATGDRGAAGYLDVSGVRSVECGDVADGADVDEPPP